MLFVNRLMFFTFLVVFVCFVVDSSDLNSGGSSEESSTKTPNNGLFLLILVNSIDKSNDDIFKRLNGAVKSSSSNQPSLKQPTASNLKKIPIKTFLQTNDNHNLFMLNGLLDNKEFSSLSQTSKETSKKMQNSLLLRKYDIAIKTNNSLIIKQIVFIYFI